MLFFDIAEKCKFRRFQFGQKYEPKHDHATGFSDAKLKKTQRVLFLVKNDEQRELLMLILLHPKER